MTSTICCSEVTGKLLSEIPVRRNPQVSFDKQCLDSGVSAGSTEIVWRNEVHAWHVPVLEFHPQLHRVPRQAKLHHHT